MSRLAVSYPYHPIANPQNRAHSQRLGIKKLVNLPNSILIVDDSHVIRQALRRLFEAMPGWDVCGEGINGPDGIKKAHQLKPDVIVLDMSMPEMDGIAVAKVLKVQMPEVPIVMFTNFAEDQFLKHEVLSAGIAHVVSKSDSQALLQAVQTAFHAA